MRHPQSNPTERVMRELGRCFRTLWAVQHTSWAKHVKEIEKLFNPTTHHSTGYVPYELHFNKKAQNEIKEIVNFPETVEIDHETKILLVNETLNTKHRSKYQKSNHP